MIPARPGPPPDEWTDWGMSGNYVQRLRIDGGWLYKHSLYGKTTMVFVPIPGEVP